MTNQSTAFTYNSLDQLVQVTRGPPGAETLLGQYDYNASGLRVRHRYSERGDVDYFYDENAVLEEFNASDNSLLAHYTYADRLLSLNTGVGIQYYHHDALGSTVNLTDPDGNTLVSYTLDPWGRIRSQSGSSINRQIFTGQEHDENTGLINFGVRYYDPDLARFLTQDAYLGDNTIPPSLHRYLYAYSNPTVYVDLLGREAYIPSRFFGESEGLYDNTTWIDKPADEYDKFAHKAYKSLEKNVEEHPSSLPVAAVGHTLVYTGQEYVDVLRLGEGFKEGGWGYLEDLLRCTVILGPLAKQVNLLKQLKHKPPTSKKRRILTEETPEPGGHQGTSIGELEQDIEVNELLEGRNAPEFAEPAFIEDPAIGNKFDDLILSKGQGGWYCSGSECIVASKRAELRYVHRVKKGKVTDANELVDQINGQIEAYNRILKTEGMAGLKARIIAYGPALEAAGRLHVKQMGPAGKNKAWLHEPDMKSGGLPKDVTRTGDRRTNSIIGGQADRISKEIIEMDDDVTEIWWSLGLE